MIALPLRCNITCLTLRRQPQHLSAVTTVSVRCCSSSSKTTSDKDELPMPEPTEPQHEYPDLTGHKYRKPIPSFPVQPGEKPAASNYVIPMPPPPVPPHKYFQDRELPIANAVKELFEAAVIPWDNRRDVPYQEWYDAKGMMGTQTRPILVHSLYDKRIACCHCEPAHTGIIYFITVHRGYMSRCPNCGNCFVLMSSKYCEIRKGV